MSNPNAPVVGFDQPDRNGASRRGSRVLGVPARPAGLVLAVALVIVVAFVAVGLPRILAANSGSGPLAVQDASPCADPAECAVSVRFSGQVNHLVVADSLRVDPPTTVVVGWKGDVLLVRPAPLLTSTTYTLSVGPFGPPSSGGRATGVPYVIHFVEPDSASAVTLVRSVEATAVIQPTVTPANTATVVLTPTPAPPLSPTVAGSYPLVGTDVTVAPTRSASAACQIGPVRGFALLFQDQPSVATQLGCAKTPESPATAIVQKFDHGQLIRRVDQAEVLTLTSDGKWVKYPLSPADVASSSTSQTGSAFASFLKGQPTVQTALGAPTGSERSLNAAVQDFDQGTLLWTADQVIYALYANGAWEQHTDLFRDPTATPGANTTAPTTTPAAPVTSASACATQPVRGFALIYRQNAGVASRLGCAQSAETASDVGRQAFDNGTMLRPAGAGNILVLKRDGSWLTVPDAWQEGQALSDVGPPPSGHVSPTGAIGAAWRKLGGPKSPLGWPTATGANLSGALETFAGGRMIWTGDRLIYALFGDGTYQSFPDTFVDATPTPTGSGG